MIAALGQLNFFMKEAATSQFTKMGFYILLTLLTDTP